MAALLAVDSELAQAYREKHRITDKELEEVSAASANAARTRTSSAAVSGPGHVILNGNGEVAYRNKRAAFEVFRSYSKSLKTGHIEGNDKFDYSGFLRDVVRSEAVTNGTTWTYGGKTWKYEYRPE
jgi:hypothetical protein